MSNCENHKKDLFGQTDMKLVAEAIGDLHYETLAELLRKISHKISDDSSNDRNDGKKDLATIQENQL